MSAQTRIPALLGTLAVLALTACGGGEEAPASAPTSTSSLTGTSSASASGGGGDLTGDQITCLDAGEAIVEARIPAASEPPAAGPEMLDLRSRIRDAVDTLDGLHAMGALADGIDQVMYTMGEASVIPSAQSGRTWTDARTDLTDAVTDLQSACTDAGVPDYLNP